MKLIVVLLSTVLSTAAFAQSGACFEADTSTIGLEECQHDEYIQLDEKLNAEHYKVILSLSQHPSVENKEKMQKLNRSHAAWEKVRESVCTIEVADREGGSSQGFAKAECLTRVTQQRIDYIQSLNFSQ